MKRIKLPGLNREIGIRMVKESAEGCIPAIEGLFLLDENMEWRATSKDVPLKEDIPSYLPVRLVGNICDEEVTWETEWQPTSSSALSPVFSGIGPVGIVGFQLHYDYWTSFYAYLPLGVLRINATCAGRTFGPVTITFLIEAAPQ